MSTISIFHTIHVIPGKRYYGSLDSVFYFSSGSFYWLASNRSPQEEVIPQKEAAYIMNGGRNDGTSTLVAGNSQRPALSHEKSDTLTRVKLQDVTQRT